MNDLSIFVNESGGLGETSRYHLITDHIRSVKLETAKYDHRVPSSIDHTPFDENANFNLSESGKSKLE